MWTRITSSANYVANNNLLEVRILQNEIECLEREIIVIGWLSSTSTTNNCRYSV